MSLVTPDRILQTEPVVYERSDIAALFRQLVKWWQFLPMVAVVLFFLWISGLFFGRVEEIDWFLVGIAGVVVALSLFSWTVRPFLAYRSLRREGLLGPQVFKITDDVFSSQSARAEIRLQWSAVMKVCQARDRLFV